MLGKRGLVEVSEIGGGGGSRGGFMPRRRGILERS